MSRDTLPEKSPHNSPHSANEEAPDIDPKDMKDESFNIEKTDERDTDPLDRLSDEELTMRFDAWNKRVAVTEAKHYDRPEQRRRKRETLFSELSDDELAYIEQERLQVSDTYPSHGNIFVVEGIEFPVQDELLVAALLDLPGDAFDIIMLAYFLGITDREIADKLHMVRRTITYRRNRTLQRLRDFMLQGGANHEGVKKASPHRDDDQESG